ncbi:uncharacterized protein LOC131427192 [Malaya genurostris]|uniref:uncharacterized protein LOC131427192 n=1 Tax=Malaya genurostris TaxID=325434 RepID=UPI0026F39A4E|nr:uncharacterized protein LOC131427192 [Malaya genurostris]
MKEERKYPQIKKEINSMNIVQKFPCPICSEDHAIYQCSDFKQAPVKERRELAQHAKLCFNCLRSNHWVKTCQSKFVCRNADCKQKHHTLLCDKMMNEAVNKTTVKANEKLAAKSDEDGNEQVVSCSANVKNSCSMLTVGTLPTAVVRVKGKNDQLYEVRAMIDCGSQASLITESCVIHIGLKRNNANLIVTGIMNCGSETTKGVVNLEISSRFDNQPVVNTKAFVLTKLTRNLPQQKIDTSRLKCLESLQLADPGFSKPSKIDLILGVDVFLSILGDKKVKDEHGLPVALNSAFGWIVAGQVGDAASLQCRSAIINLCSEINVDRTLRQFWEIEEIDKPKPLTQEEERAIELFQTTHQRDKDGRFKVRLPFDESKLALGESLPAAIQRLKAMERKFHLDPKFKKLYGEFMAEYLNLGHMERVPPAEVNIAVWKTDSTTTKLRVVFDGSSKTSTGISLNERLLVGPNLNEDLFVILTRFRSYAVAFMADAEKMYRQVWVNNADADFQRIVWRTDPELPVEHYRLLTVTYGTACAAYLAIESLRQAARDSKTVYPVAAERIEKNFYVDDLLSGADSVEDAVQLKSDIIQITSAAGFNLRKWSTNVPQLLKSNEEIQQQPIALKFAPEADSVKALGIHWSPSKDEFCYKLKLNIHQQNTKRQLLSDTARLYDPPGWISPVIVRIKILYQSLWLLDLSWDDPLPAAIDDEWTSIKSSLQLIEEIRIPRWLANHNGKIQLHGFADASEAAYAAVVYARSVGSDGTVYVSLIASKTKVAPIRQISIPKLELNAAVLLTDLLRRILEAFTDLEVSVHAWTDSRIFLEWLSAHPKKWKTFVANRTSTILDLLPRSSWNHVASVDNPADCASRGVLPVDLVNHTLWWSGPNWLQDDSERWKTESISPLPEETMMFIKRVLAWVNRFKTNALGKLRKQTLVSGNLTPSEIQHADTQLSRLAQFEQFGRDLDLIRKGLEPKNAQLKSAYPFFDGQGTLRVSGRLQNSGLPYNMRHPVILPKTHRYTYLLIQQQHLQNLHGGPTLVIASLNQRYWVLSCHTAVSSVINKCVRCARWKAKTAQQLMGSLPAVRSSGGRAFENVGVDYAGPVTLRTNLLRSSKTVKGYVAVFVCLATKAIHLEGVTDLTSNAFISALKRFCGCRGLPSQLWSDNGTNFVGADRMLRENLQNLNFNTEIDHHLSRCEVKWRFITSSASHMGGMWEAAVKSMKKHFRTVVGTQVLTFEDLTTLLVEIETCLNSRPLCALSNSADSCEALTPGHFVIGQPLNLIPEPNTSHVPENRLDRYQRLRRYTADIWERWRSEYLATLQPRNKWRTIQENIKIGDLVLVKTDNTPPAFWELARVVAVHPDANGIVRNVTLWRAQTQYQRPIQKLVVLPCN